MRACQPLSRLLDAGPVVLDGAMGTELQARGVDTQHSLWSARALLDAPDVVRQVHRDYADRGAQVLTTNTYQASAPTFEAAGLSADQAREALAVAVRLADQAAQQAADPVLVAGSIGPFGAHLADGSEYTGAYQVGTAAFDAVHRSRLETLVATGLRLFALETMPRLDEARLVQAMLQGLAPTAECWVSFQVRPDGEHLADGTALTEAGRWAQEQHPVVAVGVNCLAPSQVETALGCLATVTSKPLVAYPNSGEQYEPVTKSWSEQSHEVSYAALVTRWLRLGARLLGGCCRTSPDDTRALAEVVPGHS